MSKNIEHVQVRWCSTTQHEVELEFSKFIWRAPYMHDKEKEGYYTNFLRGVGGGILHLE
jgi:hypothetical protein